jgi:hypothetical protein
LVGGLSPTSKKGVKPPKLVGGEDALEADATGTTKTAVLPDASIKELNTSNLRISLDTSYQDLNHELTSNSIGKLSQVEVLPDNPETTSAPTGAVPGLLAQPGSLEGNPGVSNDPYKSSRRPADAVRAMCEGLGLVGWRLNFARVAVKDGASRDAW